VNQALESLGAGRAAEAAAIANSIRAAHPDHIRIWRMMNEIYIAQSQPAQAAKDLCAFLPPAPTPETMEHFCLLARAERLAGNYAAAAERADQVLAIESKLLEARFEYGLAYYHLMPLRQDCTWKTISVCLPSRLTRHPETGWYWLERAVESIRKQTIAPQYPIQICVGIDHGAEIPDIFANQPDITFSHVPPDAPKNQAAAVNAAASVATGDIIAFLEDDDAYYPHRLENALGLLQRYDFVGGTQQAVTANGVPFQIHDYANPTTWVMRHEFWKRVGPMNTAFRLHLDAEWLGRLNASGGWRAHEVDGGAPREWHALATSRRFYMYFYSVIKPGNGVYFTSYPQPLAIKTVHEQSISDITKTNEAMQRQSDEEHTRMETMYHGRPF